MSRCLPPCSDCSLLQPFHADIFCDVLALYHLEEARNGGDTLLASSWTVYNELAATRPDIIDTLTQSDWVHDTFVFDHHYHQWRR